MQEDEHFVLPNGDIWGGEFPDIEVTAKKPTIWDKYKWHIIGGSSALIVLIIIACVIARKHK